MTERACGLSPFVRSRIRRAAVMVYQGKTIKEIAHTLGVHVQTVSGYVTSDYCKELTGEMETALWDSLRQDAHEAVGTAMRSLSEIAADQSIPPSRRIAAAEVILERCKPDFNVSREGVGKLGAAGEDADLCEVSQGGAGWPEGSGSL